MKIEMVRTAKIPEEVSSALSALTTEFETMPLESEHNLDQISLALISILERFGNTDAEVVKNTCVAIRSMVDRRDQFQGNFNQAGLENALIGVLKTLGETDSAVACEVCDTLLYIERCLLDCNTVRNVDVFAVVVHMLQTHGTKVEAVAAAGCDFLTQVIKGNETLWDRLGASEVMLDALKKFGEQNAKLAHAGIYFIFKLAEEQPRTIVKVVNHGALQLVTSLLKRFGKEDDDFALLAFLCYVKLNALRESNFSKYDCIEACEVIAATLLAHPKAGLEFSHVGLKLCTDLVDEFYMHKDRLLRSGVCEAIVLVMENHAHEHKSIPSMGSHALHRLLQLEVNLKDLIPPKLLVRAGNVLMNAMREVDAENNENAAVHGASAMGWLIKNRSKAQKVRLVGLGVCEAFMSIVETFDDDTHELEADVVLKAFYETMKDIESAPDFATPRACRALVNVLRAHNTRSAKLTELVCEVFPVLVEFSPRATRYLCQAGASQEVAVGLASFGLENASFAYRAIMDISMLVLEDVEKETVKVANLTACNAIATVLERFGAEDEDIATFGCDLVHAISDNSSTGRGIFRYVCAHFAVHKAINSHCKPYAMKSLKE